jgi:diguanylate cyclase (GGDEF)-like protein/PAS domain S-box-containing protein
VTRISLFNKTLLFMIAVFGVIATATSFISATQLKSHMIEEYQSKARALARTMAESDLRLILEGDAAGLQQRIDQYVDIEGVSHVVVADERGRILAHTFVPVVPEVVRAMLAEAVRRGVVEEGVLHLGKGDETLHITQPILEGRVGWVHVGMDLGRIQRYIGAAIVRQQTLTLVVFGCCVALAWIFIRTISRPLQRLQEYARLVAKGDYSARVDIDAKDEIGELAETMQAMSEEIEDLVDGLEDRVHQATSELSHAKQELEIKVEERTSELSRANIQLKIEIAERKVVGEALKKTEQKYRAIFENAVEGIFQFSPDGYYISANPAMARIFGFDSPGAFMNAVNDGGEHFHVNPEQRAQYLGLLEERGELKDHAYQVRRRDGKIIWVSESARSVLGPGGEVLYYEGSLEDISLRKEAEEQLVHQAFHDPLTGLPNRVLFMDHLRMALERSRRREDYLFAVLYLDLDRFKIINDSLGHDIGDKLLVAAAGVLTNCARTVDTVARFGGDEFAVLLEEITAPRDAIKIGRRIIDEMTKPFDIENNEVFTSASIGIVLHTSHYTRAESLLRDADTAMYRAKELGKSRFKVFNQRMHDQALQLMELETDLRRALDGEELTSVYQPIVSLKDFTVTGFEALVRWPHPVQGLIMPEAFVPLAEDTGLVYAIDYQVVEMGCRQVRLWREAFPGRFFDAPEPLALNLNLSGKHFKQPHLLQQLERVLGESGLPPGVVNLEITESALMEQPTAAGEILHRLKRLGVGLSIDDFGTGYSSLSYLQRFPIDIVKIDRSFVMGVENDRDSRAIVRTIISLGVSLGHKVVAEGVETLAQMEFLADAGCQFAQGFLFARPMSAEDATGLMARGGVLPPGGGE